MEMLRGESLPPAVRATLADWLESVKALQHCRLQERANAFYPRDPNRLQEDKGETIRFRIKTGRILISTSIRSSTTSQFRLPIRFILDMLSLANCLQALSRTVRRARSAAWTSLMLTLHKSGDVPLEIQEDIERLKAADFDVEPPAIKVMGPVTGSSASGTPRASP